MKNIVWIACLLTLSCASGSIPVATDPVDPAEIDEYWSLHVVTVDADGAEGGSVVAPVAGRVAGPDIESLSISFGKVF